MTCCDSYLSLFWWQSIQCGVKWTVSCVIQLFQSRLLLTRTGTFGSLITILVRPVLLLAQSASVCCWHISLCRVMSFSLLHMCCYGVRLCRKVSLVGLWQSTLPPHPFTSPPSTLSFSKYLLLFSYFLSYSIYLFSCFAIPSHFIRIVSLRFQAGCCRRWLNLAFVFCIMLYVFFS